MGLSKKYNALGSIYNYHLRSNNTKSLKKNVQDRFIVPEEYVLIGEPTTVTKRMLNGRSGSNAFNGSIQTAKKKKEFMSSVTSDTGVEHQSPLAHFPVVALYQLGIVPYLLGNTKTIIPQERKVLNPVTFR